MGKKITYGTYKGSKVAIYYKEWYIIKYLSFREMMKFTNKLWYKLFCRGYTVNGVIYIRKNTLIGKEKLILHEIGHILGYKHTWWPFIMNPSWIGRWFMYFIRGEKV